MTGGFLFVYPVCLQYLPISLSHTQYYVQKQLEIHVILTRCPSRRDYLFVYVLIEGLQPRQQHRVTSWLFTSSTLSLTQFTYIIMKKINAHKENKQANRK